MNTNHALGYLWVRTRPQGGDGEGRRHFIVTIMEGKTMTGLDEDVWDDLLREIEQGRVIPVVGAGVVTRGDNEDCFYPWLARRLAERLDLDLTKLPEKLDLNKVAATYLLGRGNPNRPYKRIWEILRDECPLPGQALMDLASISAFNFFISTTFDPLLQRALDITRHGGAEQTAVYTFSSEVKDFDLPARRHQLPGTNLLYLLGKVVDTPGYVIWEDDMLEYILALHKKLPAMTRLTRDLREHWLLILGLNYSDWLVRFFLRTAKQDRFSTLDARNRDAGAYYADAPTEYVPESLVLYFGTVTNVIHVMRQDPIAFCGELARRWKARHPETAMTAPAGSATLAPVGTEMPRGAVFISYAREDEAAVIEMVRGLRESGCVVWYDRERLLAGQRWHNALEHEVKEQCGLFLSVISRTTESAREGYYHAERHWAAERAVRIAHNEDFYLPVVIDDTPLPTRQEPRIFAGIHTTSLPGGQTTPGFAQRLLNLQRQILASLP